MSTIKYIHAENAIAVITFNRDDKRNAFSAEMSEGILQSLDQAVNDKARVIVLRANVGVKVWCAGHDLSELDPQSLLAENPTLAVSRKIQSIPIPVIAMVEGGVYGGGLILLLSADIVIAATNAEVAITSNKLGIPLSPDLYAFWLRVMGIHKAKELLFTAATISASDAYNAGVFNHVVEANELERFTFEIANRINDCSADAVANAKYQLNLIARQAALRAEARLDIDRRNSEILNSDDTRDRISALLASLRGL